MKRFTQTKYIFVVIVLNMSSIEYITVLSATTGKGSCTYNDWGKEVSCRQMELVSMPTLSSPVRVLDVSDNHIRQLIEGTFSTLPFLEYIDLSNNWLREIKNGVFVKHSRGEGTPFIRFLDLSENELSKIEDNAFDNLTSLTELYLNDNLLREMTKKVLEPLRSLEILWLSKNKLTHLRYDTFHDKKNLLSLFLDGNKFAALPDAIFMSCSSLEVINLSGNQLQRIPVSLEDLPALRYLYLSNNRFIDISPVTHHLWTLQALTTEKNFLRCSCDLEQIHQWMIRKGFLGTTSDEICYKSNNNTPIYISTSVVFCLETSKVGDTGFRKNGGNVENIVTIKKDNLLYYNTVLLTCLTVMCLIWFVSNVLNRKAVRIFRRRQKDERMELL